MTRPAVTVTPPTCTRVSRHAQDSRSTTCFRTPSCFLPHPRVRIVLTCASGLPLYTTAVFCTPSLFHITFHIRQRPLARRPPSSTSPASRTRLRHC
ncbi:uncharacterized protein SCHCODRAFT_02630089 [Schizophyllum commune H4-8]|uniref:uncharacterized protein n=1 Tax=Schizophyllum commune (strain H4-8 / FGSC 9210) TaxID=578458 RepID=UPI002160D8D0|nr:uncharacterized protein SCHCODRAFT_02630089 [Schizophyllum commune H4-8]KAI5891807.1 hypothetical protein SCHCODRAFT_02630089 [Schizophyllum commune H4-8]